MKATVKKLARFLFGDYLIYYVYSRSWSDISPPPPNRPTAFRFGQVDLATIQSSRDSLIQDQASYHGPGSRAYAGFVGDRVVSLCFYWFGERYKIRNFWPLADDEAKLVHVITLPEMRGRGIASLLIAFSCVDMMQMGFLKLYARIWHSNTPSLLAFQRAGWTRVSMVIEINPFRRIRPFRICFGARPPAKEVVGTRSLTA